MIFNNDMKINENMRVDYNHSSPTLVINKPSDKTIALNFPSVDYVEKPSENFSLTIDNIVADTIDFDTEDGRETVLFKDDGIFGTKNEEWGNLPSNNYDHIVTSDYTKFDSTIDNDKNKGDSGNCYGYPLYEFNADDNCIIEFEYFKSTNDNVGIGFCDDFSQITSANLNIFYLRTQLNITQSGIIKIVKIDDKIHFYLDNEWKATKSFTLDEDYYFIINYVDQTFYFRNLTMYSISDEYNLSKNDYNVALVDSALSTEDNIIYNDEVQPNVHYDNSKLNNRITMMNYVSNHDTETLLNKELFNKLKIKAYDLENISSNYITLCYLELNDFEDNDTFSLNAMNIEDGFISSYFFHVHNNKSKITMTIFNGNNSSPNSKHQHTLDYDGKAEIRFSYYEENNNYYLLPFIKIDGYYELFIDDFNEYDEDDIKCLANGVVQIGQIPVTGTYYIEPFYDYSNSIDKLEHLTVINDYIDYSKTSTTYNNDYYTYDGKDFAIDSSYIKITTKEYNNLSEYNFKYGGLITGRTIIEYQGFTIEDTLSMELGELTFEYTVNSITPTKCYYSYKVYITKLGDNGIIKQGTTNCTYKSETSGNGISYKYVAFNFYISCDYVDNNGNPINANVVAENFTGNVLTHEGTIYLNPSYYDTIYTNNNASPDNEYFNGAINFYHNYGEVNDDINRVLSITTKKLTKNLAMDNFLADVPNLSTNPFNYGKLKIIYTTDRTNSTLFSFDSGNLKYRFYISKVDRLLLSEISNMEKNVSYNINLEITNYETGNVSNYNLGVGKLYEKNYLEIISNNNSLIINSNNNTYNFSYVFDYVIYSSNLYMYLTMTNLNYITDIIPNKTVNINRRIDLTNITNWNSVGGYTEKVIYEIPKYESGIYTTENNVINIHNNTNRDTIHLLCNQDLYDDNYIYFKLDDLTENDYNKVYVNFKSDDGNSLHINLNDIYTGSDEFFFNIENNKLIIQTYEDNYLSEVLNIDFLLGNNYRIYFSAGDTSTICNLSIDKFIVSKKYGEYHDDAVKVYNNPFMVGSVDAETNVDMNGLTLQCKRVEGSGYLMPTANGEYGTPQLIKGSGEIEFDYIYNEDLYDHNKFGIVNRIGNQVEYITFNECSIDEDSHIRIKVTNEYEQVGINDMNANIKVYVAPINVLGNYTNNDYELVYDKDVSVSLLRAGYYFVFKQQNRTSKIHYKNFVISNICYDYDVTVICRGYSKEGIIDTHKNFEKYANLRINTNDNRLKASFVDVPNAVKYIDFIIIFDDDRLSTIEISRIMLSDGLEDAPYSTDTKIDNIKNTDISFNRSFYCNYYNHHEADPVGLSIIRPTMEKINLTKIPAPNKTDDRGNQGVTVLYPYLKNCKKEDSPERVGVEYLNSCNQTLKCVYSG